MTKATPLVRVKAKILARFNDPAGRLWTLTSDPDGTLVFRIYNTPHKWRVSPREAWAANVVPSMPMRLLSSPAVVDAARESRLFRIAHVAGGTPVRGRRRRPDPTGNRGA